MDSWHVMGAGTHAFESSGEDDLQQIDHSRGPERDATDGLKQQIKVFGWTREQVSVV